MLDKIEVLEKPTEVQDEMRISLEPNIVSGNDVLTGRRILAKSFGSHYTCSPDVDLDVKRGERVAIIGNNGTGKTTILKIINGLLPAGCRNDHPWLARCISAIMTRNIMSFIWRRPLFEEISDAYPKSDQHPDPQYSGSIFIYR